MPGKRPRQIQRTTSMSQLGPARCSYAFHGDADHPHRGHCCLPKQEYLHVSMDPCPEVGDMDSMSSFMEDNLNAMAIDSSAEESEVASRTVRLATPPPALQVVNAGLEAASHLNVHQSAQLSSAFHRSHKREVDSRLLPCSRHDDGGSTQPGHFLDICYLCSKLLGHGRDVFIYRGDRAFCSVECRHMQIMADERREKGGLSGVKEGAVQVSESHNANKVETVVAA